MISDRQATYGPKVKRLFDAGFDYVEVANMVGLEGASKATMTGLLYRQRDLLRKDARDLSICAAIDRGFLDHEIAKEFDVQPRLVVALRKEVDAL